MRCLSFFTFMLIHFFSLFTYVLPYITSGSRRKGLMWPLEERRPVHIASVPLYPHQGFMRLPEGKAPVHFPASAYGWLRFDVTVERSVYLGTEFLYSCTIPALCNRHEIKEWSTWQHFWCPAESGLVSPSCPPTFHINSIHLMPVSPTRQTKQRNQLKKKSCNTHWKCR